MYQLEDERYLSDYNIHATVNMTVLLRMRGGTVEGRLAAAEGSIAEMELNYATDNYVDERDNRLQDAIDRETAILNSHLDDVHERLDAMETANTTR